MTQTTKLDAAEKFVAAIKEFLEACKNDDGDPWSERPTQDILNSSHPNPRGSFGMGESAMSETQAAKLRIQIGDDRFEAEGSQHFVNQCLESWLPELTRLYSPAPKMVEGDLYAGI